MTTDRPSRLKVFLHYSARDLDFASILAAELTKRGFIALMDRRDIELPSAEEWQHRLADLTRDADTIVFVISPNAITSNVSHWVLEEAARLGKRIVPVVHARVPQDLLPPEVSRLNVVDFEKYGDLSIAVQALADVLNTDSAWTRQHTHIGQLAQLWQAHDRHADYLLRGEALREAANWVSTRPAQGVRLNALQIDFLAASQRSQEAANRWSKFFGASKDGIRLRPQPRPLGPKLFISYRRNDTKHVAGRVFDSLKSEFPPDDIFFDVDAIPIGVDFEAYLRSAIGTSATLLALIGPNWVNRTWTRRNWWKARRAEEDFVRAEIEQAMEYGVPIIPILVDETAMPNITDLPSSMREFVKLNAASVRSGRDFYGDMQTIIGRVRDLRADVLG